jgi:DDE superfamily endonuclease
VRREPRLFGIAGTRWTLESIHRVCDWLRTTSLAGLSRLLDRLEIGWKGSRAHIHSPDLDYEAKLDYIVGLKEQVRASKGRLALVYFDEVTFYRWPTLAHAWEEKGRHQALAELSAQSNTQIRVIGALDPFDGRVIYQRRRRITLPALVGFFRKGLRRAYPEVERIYAVGDNWPEHFHPDVLVALERQEEQLAKWQGHQPPRWSKEPSEEAKRKWGSLNLPIQVVPLPTYASWLNPIEKLWRKLKQELVHLHRLAHNLPKLQAEIDRFLDQFADGSLDLLRYCGIPLVPG